MSTFNKYEPSSKVIPKDYTHCPLEGAHSSLQCFFCKRGGNYQNGTKRLPKIRCAAHPSNTKPRDIQ